MVATIQPTVAEMAAKSLAAVRVLERYGIDYCCGGQRSLAEVCEAKGIDQVSLEWELQEAMNSGVVGDRNWNSASLTELTRHIVDVHHGYLRREMPAISQRLEKVYRVYNQRYGATLTGLPEAFSILEQSLYEHMHKEESDLFRAVEECDGLASAAPTALCERLQAPGALDSLRSEHAEAGEILRRIRQITREYSLPSYACATYRTLMAGLRELEQDLHVHIHLENNILFPRVVQLASRLR